jgi:hypothetical protein
MPLLATVSPRIGDRRRGTSRWRIPGGSVGPLKKLLLGEFDVQNIEHRPVYRASFALHITFAVSMTNPVSVSALEQKCKALFSELASFQGKIREKLSAYADGKTLKGNEPQSQTATDGPSPSKCELQMG